MGPPSENAQAEPPRVPGVFSRSICQEMEEALPRIGSVTGLDPCLNSLEVPSDRARSRGRGWKDNVRQVRSRVAGMIYLAGAEHLAALQQRALRAQQRPAVRSHLAEC